MLQLFTVSHHASGSSVHGHLPLVVTRQCLHKRGIRGDAIFMAVLVTGAVIGLVTFLSVGGMGLPSNNADSPHLGTRLPIPASSTSATASVRPKRAMKLSEKEEIYGHVALSAGAGMGESFHQVPDSQSNVQPPQLPPITDQATTGDSEETNGDEDMSGAGSLNVSEFERHQALIDDVLENGPPSLRKPPSAPGQPALHLVAIKQEQNISTAEFLKRYSTGYAIQPVLIRNSQADWLHPEEWTKEALQQQLKDESVFIDDAAECEDNELDMFEGHCTFVREGREELMGKEWAALTGVDMTGLGVSTYAELFDAQDEQARQGRYLYAHEVSCGRLMPLCKRLYQPKFFRNNYDDIDKRPEPNAYSLLRSSHFPAFFFGPRGSTSPLHTDDGMTRFFILQVTGHKLVRLLPPVENWKAGTTDGHLYQPRLFTADLMHPNFTALPDLDGATVMETVLAPGDVLYIPEGWGHQALNLDFSGCVSTNYVDDRGRATLEHYFTYDQVCNRAEFLRHCPENEFLDMIGFNCSMLPSQQIRKGVQMSQFYLPLIDIERENRNVKLSDYFMSHALEIAPVSDAAMRHINTLKWMGLEPARWKDRYSRSVLDVAIANNYVQLAMWLVQQGMTLDANSMEHRRLLLHVRTNTWHKMQAWMEEVMGISPEDSLEDVVDEAASPKAPAGMGLGLVIEELSNDDYTDVISG